MCGRITITVSKKELENYYHAKLIGDFKPTYNGAPSQYFPIVKNIDSKNIALAKWGFLPRWLEAKRPQGFINSRSETIFEKPMFKKAIISQRCLIPADGFFEWDRKTKKPYYIKIKNQKIFSFAGIWESFQDDNKKDVLTYSILTSDSRGKLNKIHNRMPVVLKRKNEPLWLKAKSEQEIKNVLDPLDDFEMHEISNKINKPSNNYPELLNPIA
jgi:putative SOS response-associated peptidase YedK